MLTPPGHWFAVVPLGPRVNRSVVTGCLVSRYSWMDAALIWCREFLREGFSHCGNDLMAVGIIGKDLRERERDGKGGQPSVPIFCTSAYSRLIVDRLVCTRRLASPH